MLMVVVVVVIMVVLVIVVAVVACWWYGCHVAHNNVAPAFGVKGRKGKGNVMTHLHMWTVTMASIVTIWTTCHVAMSSPFIVVDGCCCHCGWPVMVVGGSCW